MSFIIIRIEIFLRIKGSVVNNYFGEIRVIRDWFG